MQGLRRSLGATGVIYLLAVLAASVLCAVYVLLSFEFETPESSPPDLRFWDFSTEAPLALRSSWEFHPGRFTRSLPLDSQSGPVLDNLDIGQSWTAYEGPDGQPLSAEGYGTYRLRLRLPSAAGTAQAPSLALKSGRITSAARFYWNGEEIDQTGSAATQRSLSQAAWVAMVIPIPDSAIQKSRDQWHELEIEVSNFHDTSAGIQEVLVLGELEDLNRVNLLSHIGSFFMVGIFLTMSLYHLFTYFARRADLPSLMFGMICGFLSLRILAQGDMPLGLIFPMLDFEVLTKINYLTFTFLVPPFVIYLCTLFPFKAERVLVWAAFIVSSIYSLLILGYPSWIFTKVLIYYQGFTILLALVLLGRLLLALARRHANAGLLSLGFLAVVLTMSLDIASTQNLLSLPPTIPFGILVFVFCQSLILIRRSAHAMEDSEALGQSLLEMNQAMERFVPREFFAAIHKEELTQIRPGDFSVEDMTVMVADIKNFSGLVERMSPEESFETLNRLITALLPIVRNQGGFVINYLADGFIALFPSGARSAVDAAVGMQLLLRDGHQRPDLPRQARMGIGIHSGQVMIGTIGDETRMDSTVISPTVHAAEKIQDLTRIFDCGIIVSAVVKASLGNSGKHALRSLGSFQFRSRGVPHQLFEIYEAEAREIQELKRATQKDFERAVFLFQRRHFEKARELLDQASGVSGEADAAVRYYLKALKQEEKKAPPA